MSCMEIVELILMSLLQNGINFFWRLTVIKFVGSYSFWGLVDSVLVYKHIMPEFKPQARIFLENETWKCICFDGFLSIKTAVKTLKVNKNFATKAFQTAVRSQTVDLIIHA